MTRIYLSILGLLLVSATAHGQNDTGPAQETPVAAWHFTAADEPGVTKSATKFLEAGPRPPIYPSFPATNTAMAFTAANPKLTIREADLPNANLRFGLNDSITLEAWVKVAELKDGNFAYILGKGRNRKPGFPELNQNYALRLKGERGETRITFLFASIPGNGKPAEWHRWTSSKGFTSGGWHHIAIAYTFGNPASIRGYVDGMNVKGTWDMAGATTRAPVTDNDDLTIATGNGGGAGNSFRGALDEVAIWRTALPDDVLKNRYQMIPPPPVVKRDDVPSGEVLVQLCEEGLPGRNAWPDQPLQPTETYREKAFGFFEVPHKYVDTGVRGDRGNPYLFRAAAVVRIPPGKHRILLRGRGSARLYFDNNLLLTTPFPPTDGSGHGTIAKPESYLNLGPDFRFAPPGNREAWAHFETKGDEHLVVLETIVGNYLGNGRRRPELGEMVVAISLAGTESWQLLSPGKLVVPYTDSGWAEYETERAAQLDRVNAAARAAKREKHEPFWAQRRKAARDWLTTTPDEKVPPLAKGFPAHNAIDHFLAAKIVQVTEQAGDTRKSTVDYFKHVQPILEAKCYGCHTGGKAKGDLRLDNRTAALAGGKFDGPAIAPGKPDNSALLLRVKSTDDDVMPPKGDAKVIDRLLADARWADHWTGYWQDVLAENPNIINPTLNNTGPFRFWIHESLLDNKPADLFVTELVRMEGSERFGGPAGFGVASQNDVPMAEKGIIVGSAFLGVEMKCARCHDAPSHESKQEDLFQLAALLKEDSVEVPATSSVPMDRIHKAAASLSSSVTLKPGAKVEPAWPFDRSATRKPASTWRRTRKIPATGSRP
jgi:hypothetical protein